MPRTNRRHVLKQAGLVGSGALISGLAGCVGGGESDGSGAGSDGGSNSDTEEPTSSPEDDSTSSTDSGTTTSNSGYSDLDEVSMEIASALEPGSSQINAVERFKELIEEETDGRFSVKVSPGGAYGAAREVSELCSQNGVEAWCGGSYPWQESAEPYAFFTTPFVMRDFEHVKALFKSDVLKPGLDMLRKNATQEPIGGPQYWGKRNLATKKGWGKVTEASQVKGLNLRLPEISSWTKIWSEIGAAPTPVAWTEVYSALQTGTVDAIEVPPVYYDAPNLYEVTDFYNLTGHHVQFGETFVNTDWFYGLDETYQQVVRKLMLQAHEKENENVRANIQELLKKFQDKGATIVEDVDQDSFRKAGRPAVEELFEKNYALTWDEVLAIE